MQRLRCLLPLLITMLTPPTSQGSNVIINGDFEAGLANWTITYGGPEGTIGTTAGSAHSGSLGVSIARQVPYGIFGAIAQTVATQAGAQYVLSYWAKVPNVQNADIFEVIWGPTTCTFDMFHYHAAENPGCTLVAGSQIWDNGNDTWTQFSFPVTATSTSMDLTLAGRTDFSIISFDSVSLSPTVPEPGTIWLGGIALLGMGFLCRRPRRR